MLSSAPRGQRRMISSLILDVTRRTATSSGSSSSGVLATLSRGARYRAIGCPSVPVPPLLCAQGGRSRDDALREKLSSTRTGQQGRRFLVTTAMQQHAATTVLYDGGCPLCVWEISHYQKMDAPTLNLRWLDLTSGASATDIETILQSVGSTPEAALSKLHVISTSGELHLGVDAFIEIWARLPYLRYAAPIVRFALRLPPLRWGAEGAYTWFVASSFRSNLPRWMGMKPVACSNPTSQGTSGGQCGGTGPKRRSIDTQEVREVV